MTSALPTEMWRVLRIGAICVCRRRRPIALEQLTCRSTRLPIGARCVGSLPGGRAAGSSAPAPRRSQCMPVPSALALRSRAAPNVRAAWTMAP